MEINTWNKSDTNYYFPLEFISEDMIGIEFHFGWIYSYNHVVFVSNIPIHHNIEFSFEEPDLTKKQKQSMFKDIFEELSKFI